MIQHPHSNEAGLAVVNAFKQLLSQSSNMAIPVVCTVCTACLLLIDIDSLLCFYPEGCDEYIGSTNQAF